MIFLFYPFIGEHELIDFKLESIAFFLSENSIQCQVHGFSIDDYDNLPGIQNDIVYFNLRDISQLENIKNIIAYIKSKGACILVGGHFCISIKAIDILKKYESIDIVIRDPSAELVFLDTINALSKKICLENVKGITFRGKKNKNTIIHTKRFEMPANLDHLKSPLNLKSERGQWQPIIVSSGCHNNCQYCIGQIPYKNDLRNPDDFWRKKTESQIVDEIQIFSDKGINSFKFQCDEFLGNSFENKEFVSNLMNEILKHNINIHFCITAKPRNIRDNLKIFPLLIKAGLSYINVGLDSGLDKFHQIYKTESTAEDGLTVLNFLHSNQLNFDVNFIFYEPFLTLTEIKENLKFLRDIYPFFSNLQYPYSKYLDSRILNSALILKYGMPIIEKLEKFNLIIDSPGFPANPGYRFLNRDTMIVYSAYSHINTIILPKIRHFFYDSELVNAFNDIELFPIVLMEKIVDFVEKEKIEDLSKIVGKIEKFTKAFFSPFIDNIFENFSRYRNLDLYSWVKK